METKRHFKVWNIYYDFEERVHRGNENDNNNCESLCNLNLVGSSEKLSGCKDFCKKLMRNLRYFSKDSKVFDTNSMNCNVLNNWIYNSIEKNITTNDIVKKFFETYNNNMGEKQNDEKCHFPNNQIYEPINISLLDAFNDDMIYVYVSIKENGNNRISALKLVCQCVRIYKRMKEQYCRKADEDNEKHTNTCLKLNKFMDSYTSLRAYLGDVNSYITSLDDIDKECFEINLPAELNNLLLLKRPESPDNALREGLDESAEDTDGASDGGLTSPLEMVDNSMKKSITATIGTFTGASFLIALLYKVNTKFYLNI
ncbi:hypothetical protein PCYB_004320 [Plasmodium cynomolgi strain B]|uniref:CYIR protein n=1 Tax=Plasmodium cynomolgi (strain B) TaxID=1120755 RepID=K6UNP6_PLACD|nr:hypothetical protein PCYB_004320 [Plasmodium cynomolgi strain B]GAB69683.1 hypothetical protein PCYB_004320 [Plasmodium cynomolgi strain B]